MTGSGAHLAQVAVAGLGLTVALGFLTWMVGTGRRDVSLVDRMWPLFIVGAAVMYAWLLPPPGARARWMLALVFVWAARLSSYITHRNWGHGEDRRYHEIRARNQPGFAFKSLYLVFGLQAVLSWVVAMPLLVGMTEAAPLWTLDYAAIALTVFGLLVEAVGDAQMARFKSDPRNRGQVMDRGAWRYTRHPNYFGETCLWWGLWLMAVAGAGIAGVWTIVSPVLMTILLLKVSGVALLEKDIAERRPAYRDYIARTNAFLPGPPRREDRA